MRFGDGAWRMLDDVTPVYPSRVDNVSLEPRRIVFDVSTRLEEARWATLEGHMFTVEITSPLPGVLRACVTHHKGRVLRGPAFPLNLQPTELAATETDQEVTVQSGPVGLRIQKKPWSLEFFEVTTSRVLTRSPFKGLGLMDKQGHGWFMRDQLTLGVGEQIYGLGERFQAFARTGQVVDMWNADCGTCSDKAYKNVPFFLSSKGYAILVNSSDRVSFEIGTEQVNRAQFAVPGHDLDYFFIHGPSPKQVLERLGALSGRPALPPAWSFGLWLTTSFLTDYDEATVMGFVDGMQARNLPLHVFHFDCFWMKAHHWCNFEWDAGVFPDPEGMLARLKQRGLHVCVWINPYIGERSHLFEQGVKGGYLLKGKDGQVYQRDRWQAGMAFVDFTNPAAVTWYQQALRGLLRMGVDCFKTDFGEEIPTDVEYFDGSDPERMHNYYTLLYNQAVFDLLREERGEGEAVVFARSATATCQRFPVHWGGDCYGTFESMAETLRGGLSLALSGFGFWSHDIGGFESHASPAVYKRWVAFGLMSSHSRLHGSTSYRVPWAYDEESVEVLRQFTQLKCRLMPYLMRAAVEAHQSSVPMMRAMVLEFPDDPACRLLDRQYLLGPDLLVAPVMHEEQVEYYLPAGRWLQLLTGEVREGNRWCLDKIGFLGLPAWLRENGVIPMGAELGQVDYDFAKNVRLVCGCLDGVTARTVQVCDSKGKVVSRFSLTQQGHRLTVSNLEGRSDFELQLPWAERVNAERGVGGIVAAGDRPRPPGDPGGFVIRAAAAEVVVTYD